MSSDSGPPPPRKFPVAMQKLDALHDTLLSTPDSAGVATIVQPVPFQWMTWASVLSDMPAAVHEVLAGHDTALSVLTPAGTGWADQAVPFQCKIIGPWADAVR